MLNKYVIYGVLGLAVTAGAVFAVHTYNSAISELQESKNKISNLEVEVKSYAIAFEEIDAKLKNLAEQRIAHEAKVVSLNNEINKAKRDLNALKNREATVVAKPKLVELKINKAFQKQQKRYACLTGDTTLCEQ